MEYDDGCEEGTYRWCDETNEEGYYYEIYVVINDKEAKVIVTEFGVSIEFRDQTAIRTNIVPQRLFPEDKELDWGKLLKILDILEATNCEGKGRSKKQMDELYQQFLDEE